MTDGGLDKNFTSSDKSNIHFSGALRYDGGDFLFVQQKGIRQVMTHFILQAVIKPASSVRSQR